jgi:hypothetical protein
MKRIMRPIVSKGPYINTNKLRTKILIAHINQHTIALKTLALANQFSSFDYHQLVEFKYQVSIKN